MNTFHNTFSWLGLALEQHVRTKICDASHTLRPNNKSSEIGIYHVGKKFRKIASLTILYKVWTRLKNESPYFCYLALMFLS